ncbi:hypothetical protein [Lysinibacillus capsici]|uniref:hypothetical protein n=1 Tax=Lysinibacillus capsici TaxID=2115968 RepID=UPI003081C1C6|nr:hypothetical protein ICJ70_13270 [Lysinibacillus capsici]
MIINQLEKKEKRVTFFEKYETLFDAWTISEKHEKSVFMPNELFEELLELKEQKRISASNIPTIYSYLYLQTWLWRYGMYGQRIPTNGEVKEILGYKHDNKKLNPIIGEGGLLDTLNYTKTEYDFPFIAMYEKQKVTTPDGEEKTIIDASLEMMSEVFPNENIMREVIYENGGTTLTWCKRPMHLYERLDEDGDNIGGTLDFVDYTTKIDLEVFDFCMRNPKELGCTAFYLYAYLKHKCFWHSRESDGYDATAKRIAEETGLSESTVKKYRDKMRDFNMMRLDHNMDFFHPKMDKKDVKASTNIIHHHKHFTLDIVGYEKFGSPEAIEKRQKERAELQNERLLRHRLSKLTANPVEVNTEIEYKNDNDEIETINIKDIDLELPF